MRRRLLLTIVLGTWLAGAGGTVSAQTADWANSLFSEHGIDFGPVPRGAKVRHAFVMTNRLAEPITILDVRASCGCTSGQASASVVPPGGTAVVEAQMDTRNFVGLKATTLMVTLLTASGQQGEARFGVQSNILPDIVLNPGSADFGVVVRGQESAQTISIERLGAPEWRFTRLIASEALCKVIEARVVETYRTVNGVGYALTIRIKPDAPSGPIRDEVRLVTNDPQSPSVPVLVTGELQGALTAAPTVLALGNVNAAAGAQGRFLVRGSRPFRITRIEGNGDGFQLSEADSEPRTLHVLNLALNPQDSKVRGDLRRTFRVETDAPGEAPLTLTATARLAP